ncbi:hypothetical protein TWF281_002926 [Arthrobotrys megalospora]
MLLFMPSRVSRPITRFQLLMCTWFSLLPLAFVIAQGSQGKFPSPGASRQILPVGYGPHILASNHDMIREEAGLALKALHERQSKAGLYENTEGTSWSRPGDLVIVTKKRWLKFENDLGVGDPERDHRDPLYNLLTTAKKLTQMSGTVYRLFFMIKNGIVRMGLDDSPILFELLETIYSVFTIRLQNRLVNNPKYQKTVRSILIAPGQAENIIRTTTPPRLHAELNRMVTAARQAYERATPTFLKRGGLLDFGSTLEIAAAKVDGEVEKRALWRMFGVSAGQGGKDRDIYINDSEFLLDWETIYWTSEKLFIFLTYLDVLIVPRIQVYSQMYGAIDDPAKKLEVNGPGIFNRDIIGYERYIKEKYGQNLVELKFNDPKWVVWVSTEDPKHYSDMLAHLRVEVSAVVKAALPAILDCFVGISLQVHKSGLPANSKLGPEPDFAVPKSQPLELELNLLKQYPEYLTETGEYHVGPLIAPPQPQNPQTPNPQVQDQPPLVQPLADQPVLDQVLPDQGSPDQIIPQQLEDSGSGSEETSL